MFLRGKRCTVKIGDVVLRTKSFNVGPVMNDSEWSKTHRIKVEDGFGVLSSGRDGVVMDEREWLSCKDPKEMFDFLGSVATKEKKEDWIWVCRNYVDSSGGWTRKEVVNNFEYWLVKRSYSRPKSVQYSCHAVRDIFGNPFREFDFPKKEVKCSGCDGRGQLINDVLYGDYTLSVCDLNNGS